MADAMARRKGSRRRVVNMISEVGAFGGCYYQKVDRRFEDCYDRRMEKEFSGQQKPKTFCSI